MNDMPTTSDQPVHILVVDDIEKNLIATEALLSRPGLRVLRAASGVQALELLLVHEVALALIDVNMPHMDGFELAGLMRGNSRTSSIPLIFITAAMQEQSRAFRGYKAGAVDFLNKPVDPEILRSKVEIFVELYMQRKQAERHAAALEKALELNEMYNAVLGHDLRTPLQAVLNGAELVVHRAQQPEMVAVGRLIRSSTLRMTNMVNQLLEFARMRSGQTRLNLSESNYTEVCEQIVREHISDGNGQTIKISVDGDASGIFDHDHVSRILSNLIGNALQHRTADTAVEVNIDGKRSEHVTIRVRNEGCIPEGELERIFEPYHSGSANRFGSHNLGLGLYIVQQLVAAHAGEVAVRSSPAEGTVFDIRMPRVIPMSANARATKG